MAAVDRFDYDPLGRLVRVIDASGKATEYQYDAAGNILKVITGNTAESPSIESINPATIRRGQVLPFTVQGSGLANSKVSVSGSDLFVTNPQATNTQLTFKLTAGLSASLGSQQVTVSSAAGTTSTPITVMPELPRISVSPTPLAIPPDSISRNITITLSNADVIDHTISLSSANTAKVVIQPASVTVPAGQTEVQAQIKGIAGGTSAINLNSITLGNTSIPVFITAEFKGINTSYAPAVGVLLEQPPAPPVTKTETAYPRSVLVAFGAHVSGIQPKSLTQGAAQTNLVISGESLQGVTSIDVQPSTGITLGSLSISSDGKSITVPVTVAADAPPTLRRVAINAGSTRIISTNADGDLIKIVRLPPVIDSIDPLYSQSGVYGMTMTIRGQRLQDIEAIKATPASGITFDTVPNINADGTSLTVRMSIEPLAQTGPRVITVQTSGGSSSIEPAPSNTFTIVSEIKDSITPITAPVVGVMLLENIQPTEITRSMQSAPVMVTLGAVYTNKSHASGAIGEALTLVLQGHDLQGVTAVEVLPADGVSVGAAVPQADGKSVSIPITIAENAPQTVRTLNVLAGSVPVLPSVASLSQFRVTARVPEVVSIEPVVLKIGGEATKLTIRGRNFQNVTALNFTPSGGVQFMSTPEVNAAQTEYSVSVKVDANATPGQRVVSIASLAGESSLNATEANTLTLSNNVGATVTPVFTRVGVLIPVITPPVTVDTQTFSSPVGVYIPEAATPTSITITPVSTALVGAVLGPYANKIVSGKMVQGTSGDMVITGEGLAAVTAVSLTPSTGVNLGASVVSSDGKQLTIPYAAAADAVAGLREINLAGSTGPVYFANRMESSVQLASSNLPTFESITPILANQGSLFTLTIRGQNLHNVERVWAEPADGLIFDTNPTVNAAGTEVTVRVQVGADAALGARIIRMSNPAGESAAQATERNTFTVYAP